MPDWVRHELIESAMILSPFLGIILGFKCSTWFGKGSAFQKRWSLKGRIEALLDKERARVAKVTGGLHWCPWCRQTVELYAPTKTELTGDDLQRITCGCCGGTSVWQVGPVSMFHKRELPPTKLDPGSPGYNNEQNRRRI